VVDEALAVMRFERRLQRREAGNAVVVLDHHLAVDQRAARRQLGDSSGDVGELARPIEPLAREQAHVTVLQPRLNAVAVELDLVHPALAARRGRAQRGERRRHEVGQRRGVRPRSLACALTLAGTFLGGCSRGAARPRARCFARSGSAAITLGRSGLHVVLHAPVGVPDALAALAFGDLRERAAADHREWSDLEDIRISRVARGLVLAFDQQPRLLLLPGTGMDAHEVPAPAELLALQREVELTLSSVPCADPPPDTSGRGPRSARCRRRIRLVGWSPRTCCTRPDDPPPRSPAASRRERGSARASPPSSS
jgi:hypothetical protein